VFVDFIANDSRGSAGKADIRNDFVEGDERGHVDTHDQCVGCDRQHVVWIGHNVDWWMQTRENVKLLAAVVRVKGYDGDRDLRLNRSGR
jgi:hypothetical protein